MAAACAAGSFASAAGPAEQCAQRLVIRVAIADPAREIPKLQRADVDVAGADVKSGTIDVVGDASTLRSLRAVGLTVEVEQVVPTAPDSNPLTDYMEPAEIDAAIDALVAAHPAIAKKIAYAVTEEGRTAYALKISRAVELDEDEPSVFFVALHHAREVMTPEIALDIATQLLSGYGTDPKITGWVSSREIFVLPDHNPDGSYYVFHHDKTWRKNRRDNGDRTFGVDLNRNYPFHWNACGGSSGDTSSDGYRGPYAGSEPETAGLLALAQDRRPVISLSYHTYGEQVLIPFGCSGAHPGENAVFRSLSSDIASRSISDDGTHWYAAGAPWEILYGEDGEANGWFYGVNGTYSLEIEANSSSQGFQPSYAQWRDSTVTRSRPGWQYALDRIDGPGISGHVTDACSGAPLSASISLDEISFVNGELPRTSEPRFGRYQWLTNAGSFHVRADAPGYASQVWPVTVGPVRVDRPMRLVPAASRAIVADSPVVADATGDGDTQADPGERIGLGIAAVNVSASAITGAAATLSTSDPYVTITDGVSVYGAIAAGTGVPGDGFSLAVSAVAPEGHLALLHLHFTANEPLCAADQDVSLRITGSRPACPVVENLDAPPGWAIDNSTSSGWEFGPPAGDGGVSGPASAATGTNVYGTNLAGPYANSADYKLTAGPYDLRGMSNATLSFRSWIDNEPGQDPASVDVSVDGGASWIPLETAFGFGEAWKLESIPLGAAVDGQSDARIRFRLRSDASGVRAGFYVDDFSICGDRQPRAPNGVGSTVRAVRSGSDVTLDWIRPGADAAHDPPVAYRIYRSTSAASGFAVVLEAATAPAILPGDAATPDAAFYLVAAFNSGGSSPDSPP